MAFAYKRSLTVDYTKVPTATQTDFAVWVDVTSADLKTVANGGHVQNASGHDIHFYTDSALTTLLSWDPLIYDAATGRVRTRVKRTLSHTADTEIWIAYGDSGITTFQGGSAGAAWNSGYVASWPCYEDPVSNGTAVDDKTSAGLDGSLVTNNGSTNKSVDGKLYKAVSIDGSGDYFNRADADAFTFSSTPNDLPFSFEGWFWFDSLSGWHYIFSKGSIATVEEWLLAKYDTDLYAQIVTSSSVNYIQRYGTLTTGAHQGQWIHIATTYSGSETAAGIKIYINGSRFDTTSSGAGTHTQIPNTSAPVRVGADASADKTWAGKFSDLRIHNVERSAAWVTATYNNESSPSTFYALGTEQSIGGSVNGSATLNGELSIAASLLPVRQAAVVLPLAGDLTAAGTGISLGAATLEGAVAAGFSVLPVRPLAALDVPLGGDLVAAGLGISPGAATLEGALAAGFTLLTVRQAAVALPLAGDLTVAGTGISLGAATLDGAIAGTFSLLPVRPLAAVALPLLGDLEAAGTAADPAGVTLSGGLTAGFTLLPVRQAGVALPLAGDLTAAGTGISLGAATLDGAIAGTFSLLPVRPLAAVALPLLGDLEAAGTAADPAGVTLSGGLTTGFTLLPVRQASVALPLAGELTAAGTVADPAGVALSGGLAAGFTLNRLTFLQGSFVVAGDLAAAGLAHEPAFATIEGGLALDCNLFAYRPALASLERTISIDRGSVIPTIYGV